MTVKELIEKLMTLPQDAIVVREVTELDKEDGADFITDFIPDGSSYEQLTFTKIESAHTLNGHGRPDLAYIS